ncbi:Aldehyde dehydrogenase [Seminavis robusta]|uniref:Aldehyde dehydrogenase n=1 Tax=Seminavis robusta TaxID=568900 RepID=A0A9N8ETZ7_9STRA|nr:Aldehyde dehydrogenase [Seminavis robusta]|eukprot:Sro1680_g290770.1 Aldehyde dehydrogenase (479) ;mRNA; r:6724-8160
MSTGTFNMLVNGKMVNSDTSFDVINPATAEVAAQVPECTEAQCVEAIDAANKAFKTWQAVDMAERKKCLERIIKIVEDNVDELSRLVVLEQGKSLAAAKIEVLGLNWLIGNALKIETPPDVYSDTDDRRIEVRRKPVGTIACITGWNFPLFLAVQKIAPGVVLGNTIVWKPSPYTPLSPLKFAELVQDVFPPGVFNVVTDAAPPNNAFNAGAFLTNHPKIDKVSFTGSVPTGKAIMAACASNVKRLNLELGGNDCAIVRGDVDVKETAQKVFNAAFGLSGQVCVAVKRVLVHESIFDQFQTEMVSIATAAEQKMGNGLEEGIEYGPLTTEFQWTKIKDLVEDAKSQGAQVQCGGGTFADKKGYFYKPTIVTGAKEGIRLWDEEQFGPVLPLAPFATDQEAVERANDSEFGLGGSVWSKDMAVANDMAAKILSGTVWVNQHSDITGAPFGGFKQSGIGRELGKSDVDAFTELQTLSLAK